MPVFSSLDQFAEHMGRRMAILVGDWHALNDCAQLVRDRAIAKLGTFQPAVGPFPAWQQPLADWTQRERVEQGFTPNDPLLRDGSHIRDTISYDVDHVRGVATIGSPAAEAEDNELGTARIPPRPFLGPALHESIPDILAICGDAAFRALVPGVRGASGARRRPRVFRP